MITKKITIIIITIIKQIIYIKHIIIKQVIVILKEIKKYNHFIKHFITEKIMNIIIVIYSKEYICPK